MLIKHTPPTDRKWNMYLILDYYEYFIPNLFYINWTDITLASEALLTQPQHALMVMQIFQT